MVADGFVAIQRGPTDDPDLNPGPFPKPTGGQSHAISLPKGQFGPNLIAAGVFGLEMSTAFGTFRAS